MKPGEIYNRILQDNCKCRRVAFEVKTIILLRVSLNKHSCRMLIAAQNNKLLNIQTYQPFFMMPGCSIIIIFSNVFNFIHPSRYTHKKNAIASLSCLERQWIFKAQDLLLTYMYISLWFWGRRYRRAIFKHRPPIRRYQHLGDGIAVHWLIHLALMSSKSHVVFRRVPYIHDLAVILCEFWDLSTPWPKVFLSVTFLLQKAFLHIANDTLCDAEWAHGWQFLSPVTHGSPNYQYIAWFRFSTSVA